MPAGRCAGCGYCDSNKKVNRHTLTCLAYLDLYRSSPARCLSPAEEYLRYRREHDNPSARQARRDVRLGRRFVEMQELHDKRVERWQRPKDILDD